MWQGQIGQVKATEHHIDLTSDARPQRQQPYLAGTEKRKVIEEHIDELISANVIEPAQSPWIAPVLFAYQHDKVRFCIDYCRLNAITVKKNYPLPLIEDCLNCFGKSKRLTTLDCNSGYWKILISEKYRDKALFVSHCGQ